MTDLQCNKCGLNATYNQAACYDNGHDEDGMPVEDDCDHDWEEVRGEDI